MRYLIVLLAIGLLVCSFCFGQDYQQDKNSKTAREWKNYAAYVAEQAEIQCSMWRDKYEAAERALAVCNELIDGRLHISYTDTTDTSSND